MKFTATALLLALLNGGAQSWRVAPGAPVRDRATARSAVVGDERGLDRRAAIAAGLSTTAAATLALQPRASLAANAAGGPVGEGGLPPGAAEFERVVRGQRNWENVGKRLSKASASDITTKDWDDYGKLLREMYNLGDDMSVLSKNLEKAKSEQAKKLIRGFKDELRAADGPVFQKDFAALSKAVSSTNGELAEYMALFQDVPDEI